MSEPIQSSSQDQQLSAHDIEVVAIRQIKLTSKLAKEKNMLAKDHLKGMDLSQNYINFKYLKTNQQLIGDFVSGYGLEDLDLSYNLIDTASLDILFQAFGGHSVGNFFPKTLKLKKLNLRHNKIGPESSMAIVPFLKHLKCLDMSENPLTDAFFTHLFVEIDIDINHHYKFTLESLKLQDCQLSDRTLKTVTRHLKHFPHLENIDFSYNQDESDDLKKFQEILLIRARTSSWGNSLPKQKHQPLSILQPLSHKALLMNDLNELNSLRYILLSTGWLIKQRILTLSQTNIEHIIPAKVKLIPRFLNLTIQSLGKATAADKKQGAIVDLNSVLPLEVVTAQYEVVQIFRERVLYSNICYFDISLNQLDEQSLIRALDLLKICSHKIKVLKLDGNQMTASALQALLNHVETLGLTHIHVLSLSNCGLKCICDTAVNNQCLVYILSKIIRKQPHLVRLDISKNAHFRVLNSHLFQDTQNINLLQIDLAGSIIEIEQFKQLQKRVKLIPTLRQLQLISPEITYNPEVLQYVERKFKLSATSDQQSFDLHYCIVSDLQMKSIEDLQFFSINDNHTTMHQCLQYSSGQLYTLISAGLLTSRYKSTLSPLINLKPVLNKNQWFDIYESFECSLIDFIHGHSNNVKISNIELSHMVLDFYEQQTHIVVHPSQLVIVGNYQKETRCFKYVVKALPFETVFSKSSNDDVDLQNAIKSLESFIIGQEYKSKKEQIYQILGIWKKVLSMSSIRDQKVTEFNEEAGKLLRYLKHGNYRALGLMIPMMTIIDDIFGVRPFFKKIHTDQTLIERQIDKLLLKFYIKIKSYEYDHQSFSQNQKEVDLLYQRVIKLLE